MKIPSRPPKILWYWIALPILALGVLLLFYLFFLNFLEPTEQGIVRNEITGEMWTQNEGGWYFTAPWVRVSRVDLRPKRVAVTTAGRGFSAKLVQFQPSEWREFVETEGFRYWWWANRISFNLGYEEEYRGLKDIIRGYAYGVKPYKFIKILEEYYTK
jgi:hypothetical protein